MEKFLNWLFGKKEIETRYFIISFCCYNNNNVMVFGDASVKVTGAIVRNLLIDELKKQAPIYHTHTIIALSKITQSDYICFKRH